VFRGQFGSGFQESSGKPVVLTPIFLHVTSVNAQARREAEGAAICLVDLVHIVSKILPTGSKLDRLRVELSCPFLPSGTWNILEADT
jgi:hypothetical protein